MARNKDCTSFELEKTLRNRMNVVATFSRKTMKAWLESKILEDEKKFNLPEVPPGVSGPQESPEE